MSEKMMYTCAICGFQWKLGLGATHDCGTVLDEQRIESASAYAVMTRRAEQAETALRESRRNHEESNDSYAKDIADMQKQLAELTRQRDTYKVENESRAIWIKKMNAILGYDNSDGFHSDPTPHEIAQRMKDDLAHAFNSPGAGKIPLSEDAEAQFEILNRENDKLRLVMNAIANILNLADEE